MTDHAHQERQALLKDSREFRHALKIKRAIAFLGDRWLCHHSQQHTRTAHRAHVSGPHPFRFPQWTPRKP